jgi:hypothetical protein
LIIMKSAALAAIFVAVVAANPTEVVRTLIPPSRFYRQKLAVGDMTYFLGEGRRAEG